MDNFTILATKILTEQTIQGNQQVTHRDTEDNESGIRSLKNWDVEVSCFCPFKFCEKSIYPNVPVSAIEMLSKEEEVIEDP